MFIHCIYTDYPQIGHFLSLSYSIAFYPKDVQDPPRSRIMHGRTSYKDHSFNLPNSAGKFYSAISTEERTAVVPKRQHFKRQNKELNLELFSFQRR